MIDRFWANQIILYLNIEWNVVNEHHHCLFSYTLYFVAHCFLHEMSGNIRTREFFQQHVNCMENKIINSVENGIGEPDKPNLLIFV